MNNDLRQALERIATLDQGKAWIDEAVTIAKDALAAHPAADPAPEVCPDCGNTGYVGNNGPGILGNNEYHRCECGNKELCRSGHHVYEWIGEPRVAWCRECNREADLSVCRIHHTRPDAPADPYMQSDDGDWLWWPAARAYRAHNLRDIADELARRNGNAPAEPQKFCECDYEGWTYRAKYIQVVSILQSGLPCHCGRYPNPFWTWNPGDPLPNEFPRGCEHQDGDGQWHKEWTGSMKYWDGSMKYWGNFDNAPRRWPILDNLDVYGP